MCVVCCTLQSAVDSIHVLVNMKYLANEHNYCVKKHTSWLTKKSTHPNKKNNFLYGYIECASWPPWMGFFFKRSFESNGFPIEFLTTKTTTELRNSMVAKLTDIFLVYYRTELFIWKNCRCNIYKENSILWSNEGEEQDDFRIITFVVVVVINIIAIVFSISISISMLCDLCTWCWCAAKWRWHRLEKMDDVDIIPSRRISNLKRKQTKNTSICHTWTADIRIQTNDPLLVFASFT